ncbi:hypothetical protein DSO57_1038597 [Entomophthora muscae]|uniref:Uncharacterized protein n=2 Tax=Entomophthora muscae TaxID=34485 RepID=A0ACC2S1B7_9FUNG|nr:hypothetical protein DSO57_1035852 [Entomophthora muscae]KAJ9083055.1 hypothetical protein DSO57_1038597 [Entomophthora muscae]
MKILRLSLVGSLFAVGRASRLYEVNLASPPSVGIEIGYTVQSQISDSTFAATLDFRLAKKIESGWQFAFDFNSTRTSISQLSLSWVIQEGKSGWVLIPPPQASSPLRCKLEIQTQDFGYGLSKFAIQLLPSRKTSARRPLLVEEDDPYAYQLEADGTTLIGFPIGLVIYLLILTVGSASYAIGIRTRIHQRNHFRYLQQQRMHITGYLNI